MRPLKCWREGALMTVERLTAAVRKHVAVHEKHVDEVARGPSAAQPGGHLPRVAVAVLHELLGDPGDVSAADDQVGAV